MRAHAHRLDGVLVIEVDRATSGVSLDGTVLEHQRLEAALALAEELANALSVNVIAWQAAVMVGPAVAGIIIARWGVAPIYAIDAVSFFAMLAALTIIAP